MYKLVFSLAAAAILFAPRGVSARNYALVVAGAVPADPQTERTLSHDFGVGLYRMTAGLIRSGYETSVLFSAKQGKASFTEAKAIQKLAKEDNQPTIASATRANFFSSVKVLEGKVQTGDKVVLHVQAHGSNYHDRDNTEGWSFCLDGSAQPPSYCDPIQDRELTAVVQRLQARGARVAVVVDSCHSGSFRRNLQASLRDPTNRPPICLITSSLKDRISEACMKSDYGTNGVLLNSENRSVTSAAGFFHTWIHWRSRGHASDPMGKGVNPCWNAEAAHFDECRQKAQSKGLSITADSSVKEVLRAGRLCDESSTFFDSTGRATENALLSTLLEPSAHFVYGGPPSGEPPRPVSAEHQLHAISVLEKALERPAGNLTNPFEKELRERAGSVLSKYRENLASQRKLIGRYDDLTKNPANRPKALAVLGDRVKAVNQHFADEHKQQFKGDPRPDSPPLPPVPTVETAGTFELYFLLMRRAAHPETPAADQAAYREAAAHLSAGSEGAETLEALRDLERRQNGHYRELLAIEREIYESTLGQDRDSCSDFTL